MKVDEYFDLLGLRRFFNDRSVPLIKKYGEGKKRLFDLLGTQADQFNLIKLSEMAAIFIELDSLVHDIVINFHLMDEKLRDICGFYAPKDYKKLNEILTRELAEEAPAE